MAAGAPALDASPAARGARPPFRAEPVEACLPGPAGQGPLTHREVTSVAHKAQSQSATEHAGPAGAAPATLPPARACKCAQQPRPCLRLCTTVVYVDAEEQPHPRRTVAASVARRRERCRGTRSPGTAGDARSVTLAA